MNRMEMILMSKAEFVALLRQEFSNYTQPALQLPTKPELDITDISEISEMTGLSIQTLYHKTCKNEFPAGTFFKKGKRLYFSKKAVMSWLQSGNIEQ